MGKASQIRTLNNALENNEKLCFSKQHLTSEQFEKLHKSYKQLLWFQIAPAIVLVLVIILELIFIPSEAVPNGYASTKETIIAFEVALFIMPFFPLWLIISQYSVGKLWHKYSKWYKREGSMDNLYDIFK